MKNTAIAAAALAAAAPAAAGAAETVGYSYDALGRLTKVERTGNPATAVGQTKVVTSYGHDKADNRVTAATTGSANPPPT